jgi:hypothetical protein
MTNDPDPAEQPQTPPAPEPPPAGLNLPPPDHRPTVADPVEPMVGTVPAGMPVGEMPPPPEPEKRRGLPGWLRYGAVAIIPAVIAAIAVYFVASGGDGGGSNGGAAVDGFVRLGAQSEDSIVSYPELPPGYPEDLPEYPGADLVGAFFLPTQQGGVFLAVYQTGDSVSDVVSFYETELDEDPWQLEGSRRENESGGASFNSPTNADVTGNVSVRRSDIDGETSIIVQFQDLQAVADDIVPDDEFVIEASLAIPENFPDDIPIYEGSDGPVTVTTAAFQRSPQAVTFLVSFLTTDSESDVIDFYQEEFSSRGWTVEDAQVEPGSFARAIQFNDDADQVQGQVQADQFAEDDTYTQVDLVVLIDPQRGDGN